MFWGYFSFDKKRPCHIWKPETAAERKAVQIELDKWNAAAEPVLKAVFETTYPDENWIWDVKHTSANSWERLREPGGSPGLQGLQGSKRAQIVDRGLPAPMYTKRRLIFTTCGNIYICFYRL
jgi:hypothetical protein